LLPEKSVKLLTVLNAWLLLYLAFQKKKSKTKIEGAHTTAHCTKIIIHKSRGEQFWADCEQLLRAIFSCFPGQEKIEIFFESIVASTLKSCIKCS
jgi:hypothetical protein